MVDQFGYRPADPKVAVLVDPQVGYNAAETFAPDQTYEVRRSSDDVRVYSGAIRRVYDGKTQPSSGDRGYWFDFSSVREPGSYYLYDSKNKARSHTFDIRADVYQSVLKAAVRMFFYNRSGAAKQPPFTDPRWSDGPAYLGKGQDGEARSVDSKDDASLAQDVSGGWFDAGDTNKYVTFAGLAVHRLLAAYREAPLVWSDDFGIPESDNGIPDLLDEIKWEIDWIRRMQQPDGGVLTKVGVLETAEVSPPSQDHRPRYFVPACSSATIAAASVFAHAALIFATIPALVDYSVDLRRRARDAWKWYHAHPKRIDCDSREVKSGDADRSLKEQSQEAVVAAVYLFAATRETEFKKYVDQNFRNLQPFHDIGWSRYEAHQGEAILFYTTLQGISSATRTAIIEHKRSDTVRDTSRIVYAAGLTLDLYRAHIANNAYHWGSNQVRANYATTNLDVITYGLADANGARYAARALGHLHYFHGVNPQGIVYLSNMRELGAEVSVNEIYHAWFSPGTKWHNATTSSAGPAPGYLVGGPNANYTGTLSPPARQPRQKSYRDWTGDWQEKPWEITEPSIIYQAAYVKLLSKFVPQAKR